MARRKERMSDEKRNVIASLIEMYDVKTAEDIQDALKDLLGDTLEAMLKAEMTEHLGYDEYERSENGNSRNGTKTKTVISKHGELEIEVPQDRDSTFEPKVVGKRKRDISAIESKIIAMYAKGLSTRQISEHIMDIYGFEVSESFVSDVTDQLLPVIEEWQHRPLEDIYPVVFIDAVHYSVKTEGIVKKLAAYVALGINMEGYKEVLGLYVGANESSKYWLGILNEMKNRGVQDIFIVSADGLSGMKEAISAAFPKAEYQRCIVHQVRNTLKYSGHQNKKEFAKDLRAIYHAPNEDVARKKLTEVTAKWEKIYPNSMKSWERNWDAISPIFKFSADTRKIIVSVKHDITNYEISTI